MFLRILIGTASVAALTGGAWAASVSTVTQDATTNGVAADVEQVGASNASTVWQGNSSQDSLVEVYQLDYGTTGAVIGNTSNVQQDNQTDTTASVSQVAYGSGEGSGNLANILQSSAFYFAGTGNAASVTQYGDGNDATIDQFYMSNSEASIWQSGTGNVGRVYQWWGDEVTGGISQAGSGNQATIWQYDPDYLSQSSGLYAGIGQYGDNNYAEISQHDASNTAIIGQSGDWNESTITQSGTGNYAYNDQWGDGNASTIVQSNSGNQAFVYQWSNDNVSTVTQSGVGGYVFVWQH